MPNLKTENKPATAEDNNSTIWLEPDKLSVPNILILITSKTIKNRIGTIASHKLAFL
ncbi:hypothetical protein GCM10007049_02730 [Echinicola pacifica]|uniref:Uncharacterized protein n=1 Tax=Echinicola pacifica TaxID=346377 RepID=A0A918PL70_9BACT|nr:hypothetical protein GCM10007049_02730 [Echinicola pacifica]